jgi:hypothetical protein
MTYKRFDLAKALASQPCQAPTSVAVVATVAGGPRPYPALARESPTVKFNNNNNNIEIKGLKPFEAVSLSKNAAAATAPISPRAPIPPATPLRCSSMNGALWPPGSAGHPTIFSAAAV